MPDVRNCYANKSWDVFNKFLQQTQPLNGRVSQTLPMLSTLLSHSVFH